MVSWFGYVRSSTTNWFHLEFSKLYNNGVILVKFWAKSVLNTSTSWEKVNFSHDKSMKMVFQRVSTVTIWFTVLIYIWYSVFWLRIVQLIKLLPGKWLSTTKYCPHETFLLITFEGQGVESWKLHSRVHHQKLDIIVLSNMVKRVCYRKLVKQSWQNLTNMCPS